MKQVYTSIILLITMLFGAMTIAQEGQKKYINYQGVARNADGNLMKDEPLTIGVKLDFGSSGSSFEETHELTTDANGVFSLLIGKGNVLSGEYDNLPWGDFTTKATVSINGNEIGTTELMAVPYALSSADNQWHTTGDDIENKNGGNVFITGSLYASKNLSLAEGAVVNEFSTDITLGENSDEIIPTQKAIKTYVDSQLGGSGGGADDQTAAEVAYDNSTSGLTATTAQTAIDELVGSGAVDADADPNNEIQTLSFDGATNELSLTDGGSVILPTGAGAVDADSDPTNEIQDISLLGTELTISDGSTIDLAPIVPPGGTDDQNAGEVPYDNTTSGLAATDSQAAIDELASGGLVDTDDQNLSLSGTTLQITDGTSVDLSPIIPAGGTDDQNADEVPYDNTASGLAATDSQAAIDELASGGLVDTDDQDLILAGDLLTIEDGAGSVDLSTYKDADVTTKTGILLGDGSNVTGLVGTADGQVAKWNAGAGKWEAGTDATGGGNSLWEENEDGIYRSNGYASIGHTPVINSKLYVHSALPGVRNGISSYVFHPGYKVGISGSAVSNDNDLTFGMRSSVTSNAGATSYAYRADINGPGSGTKYGFFSRIHSGTGGQKYGIYSDGENRNYFSGNIGVGTETPAAKVHVKDNSTVTKPHIKLEEEGADYARLEFTNNTSNALWHIAGLADNSPANSKLNFYFRNNNGAANRMTITGDGNVFVDGSLAHSSDLRLKKDIRELPYGLKELLVLDPKIYRWIDNRNNGSMSLGLIAQEVQQVIPEIVHEDDDSEKTLSLSYTELIPVVITAIKEQHQVIKEQSKKISDLEARLTVLEAKL